jgi:predicted DCC family thiol-disulfide oxidoreductase YuxK
VTRLHDRTETPGAGMIVYYDGGCPLCTREIRVMRRLDRHRRLSFLDVTRHDVGDMDRDALLRRFHVRGSDGRTVSGAAAFAAVWRELPAVSWLGRLAATRPVVGILEAAYRGFLRLRPGLQTVFRRLERGGGGL